MSERVIRLTERPQQRCSVCGEMQECRPYLDDGALICFDCMMENDNRQAQANRAFEARLRGERPLAEDVE